MLLTSRILRYVALFGGVGLAIYLFDGWVELVSVFVVLVITSLFDAFLPEKGSKGEKRHNCVDDHNKYQITAQSDNLTNPYVNNELSAQ